MITIVAKMRIKADKTADAEKALLDMVEYVRANEPGTLRYMLHRGIGDASQLLMYEQYADQAAVDAHGTSARIQQLFGTLGPYSTGSRRSKCSPKSAERSRRKDPQWHCSRTSRDRHRRRARAGARRSAGAGGGGRAGHRQRRRRLGEWRGR